MKKIILSLIFVMIALAGVSCASASSDFNDTVGIDPEINVIDDIDDVAVNDTEENPINDTGKIVENTTEEIQDPLDYYSAQYKEFKENSNSWFSIPTYAALYELSNVLYKKYDKNTAINLLTDIFCHVEFQNPCNIVRCAAYIMITDLYNKWHPNNHYNYQKDHKRNSDYHSDSRKPLG